MKEIKITEKDFNKAVKVTLAKMTEDQIESDMSPASMLIAGMSSAIYASYLKDYLFGAEEKKEDK